MLVHILLMIAGDSTARWVMFTDILLMMSGHSFAG